LLHHHHSLLTRTNRSHLRWLLDCSLPTYRWKGQTDRGLLIPKKVDVSLATFLFVDRTTLGDLHVRFANSFRDDSLDFS
jgi:hypothetical protein